MRRTFLSRKQIESAEFTEFYALSRKTNYRMGFILSLVQFALMAIFEVATGGLYVLGILDFCNAILAGVGFFLSMYPRMLAFLDYWAALLFGAFLSTRAVSVCLPETHSLRVAHMLYATLATVPILFFSLPPRLTLTLLLMGALPVVQADLSSDYARASDIMMCLENIACYSVFASLTLFFSSLMHRQQFSLYRNLLQIHKAHGLIKRQQAKNAELLENLFPPMIREFVEQHRAESFQRATIVFADLENFSELGASLKPRESINLLNKVFILLDSLTSKYKLLKVKTTGEVYIAVANIPQASPTAVIDAIRFSLDGLDGIRVIASSSGFPLRPRFGVNTGFVVAGTMHTSRLTFDLFGDAVNVAHRMMAHGVPGAVQISASTLHALPRVVQQQVYPEGEGEGEGEPEGDSGPLNTSGTLLSSERAAAPPGEPSGPMSESSASSDESGGAHADPNFGSELCDNWMVHPRGQIHVKHHGVMEAFLISRNDALVGTFLETNLLLSTHPPPSASATPSYCESVFSSAHGGSVDAPPDEAASYNEIPTPALSRRRRGSLPGRSATVQTLSIRSTPAPVRRAASFASVGSSHGQDAFSDYASVGRSALNTARSAHSKASRRRRHKSGSVRSYRSNQSDASRTHGSVSTRPSNGSQSGSTQSTSEMEEMFEELGARQDASADVLGMLRNSLQQQLVAENDDALVHAMQGSAPEDGPEMAADDDFAVVSPAELASFTLRFRDQFHCHFFLRDRRTSARYLAKSVRKNQRMFLIGVLCMYVVNVLMGAGFSVLVPGVAPLVLGLRLGFMSLVTAAFALPLWFVSHRRIGATGLRVMAMVYSVAWFTVWLTEGIAGELFGAFPRSDLHTMQVIVNYFFAGTAFLIFTLNSPIVPSPLWFKTPFTLLAYVAIWVISALAGNICFTELMALFSIYLICVALVHAYERHHKFVYLEHESVRRSLQRMQASNEKNTKLLQSTLPPAVLTALKHNQNAIAQRIPQATVFFADFVKFTEFCTLVPSVFVVQLLDEIYSRFDEICVAYNCTPIATIGDCYFAGSGIVTDDPAHLRNCVTAAYEMLHALRRINKEKGIKLEVRVGLSTGPVFAGVLGVTRFTYDVWGPAVNDAKKLEAAGSAKRILVSHHVKLALEQSDPTMHFRAGPTVNKRPTYLLPHHASRKIAPTAVDPEAISAKTSPATQR